jgi:hypothetical protein
MGNADAAPRLRLGSADGENNDNRDKTTNEKVWLGLVGT